MDLKDDDRPFQIGTLSLSSRLLQGPMAGVSCSAFRRLAWRIGQPGCGYSEMIAGMNLAHGHPVPPRYLHRDPLEQVLGMQISASTVEVASRATAALMGGKVDLIDLNCGCPMRKIRKKNAGSRLVEDPDHLADLVRAMCAESDVPITVKLRKPAEGAIVPAAQAAVDAGAAAVTVHGRSWQDDYDVPVDLDAIAAVVDAVPVPVIGNGDVVDLASARAMIQGTQCAAIMIGRASTGNPWIFPALRAGFQGKPVVRPSTNTVLGTFQEHLQGLLELEPPAVAVRQCRGLAKYYFRQATVPADALARAVRWSSVSAIEADLAVWAAQG